ncbi:type I-E CRISPR-associated protein Cas6/Cse3/CasE [uncultured Sphingomonas sp.]|uniref:type I-E CRISPR-associated protein Cas6/Cse3/CasE n=1 Tax=uncultured Sphingomonas sp. TaxID=158754 RepID=UPI002621FC76|nr:type I-E CRISPR-associated protein Cas6/Cse3/CasE [uncultured Sphingomonas sp.]
MTLHLVRVPLDLHALATFAAVHGIDDDDGGYALHRALRDRFGTTGPQPFRFLPEHGSGPHLLGYTADPLALDDAGALPVADDLLRAVFTGPWQAQAMPAVWREGARYGFEVRVRPVVRFGKSIRAARSERAGAWQRNAGEIDAHVAAGERVVAAGGDAREVDREAVYIEWLARRLEGVATLDSAGLRQFRRSRARRSTHRPGGARTRAVEGPDAVMGGTLTIVDPQGFAELLARGVGRHAAFGYGMLLLSAPGRAG